jgi:hypothetical protein
VDISKFKHINGGSKRSAIYRRTLAQHITPKVAGSVANELVPVFATNNAEAFGVTWSSAQGVEWNGSYGGEKWAECARAVSKLGNATKAFFKNPTSGGMDSVITAANKVENVSHNGDQLTTKFGPCWLLNVGTGSLDNFINTEEVLSRLLFAALQAVEQRENGYPERPDPPYDWTKMPAFGLPVDLLFTDDLEAILEYDGLPVGALKAVRTYEEEVYRYRKNQHWTMSSSPAHEPTVTA